MALVSCRWDLGRAVPAGVESRLFCGVLGMLVLVGCSTLPQRNTWSPPPASTWKKPLTLQKCVNLALNSDISAAEWKAREQQARSELMSAQTLPNPVFTQLYEDRSLKDTAGKSLGLTEAALEYPIGVFWTRPREIAAAKAGVREAGHDTAEDKRALKKAVGETFYRVFAEQELVDIASDDVKAAKEVETGAIKRRDLGEGSGFEAERAASERMAAERDLDAAERNLAIDRLTLAFQLGADRPAWPELTSDWPELPAKPVKLHTRPSDAQVSRALARRPDYAAAVATREQAQQNLLLEQRKAVPLGDASGAAAKRNTPDGRSDSQSFAIPIPLLNQNKGGIRKAEGQLLEAEAQEEKLRREVIADLALTQAQYGLAASQQRQYTAPLAAQRKTLFEQARKLFDAGEIEYADMTQSYREMLTARRADLEAKRDAAVAHWNQDIASGL
jgi:outer membrane protein, heavy metal efflux system